MSIVSPELKAEIDQLRQDNYRLRADYTELRQIYDHKCSMLIEAEKYNGWHQLAMLEVTRLRAENERLVILLQEYGEHHQGCDGKFGNEYRCRCGWRQVCAEQAAPDPPKETEE